MHKGMVWILILFALGSSLPAQEKLAQTGFQFLSVETESRATALGEAYTTDGGTSTALLFNPAGLASLKNRFDVGMSWNRWIADINYNSVTLATAPRQGHWGVFGLSFIWVDYGEFLGTMVWNNSKGFMDTETFSPSALAVGLGYGRSLTDKFSVGGQMKYALLSSGRSVVPDAGAETGLKVTKYVLSVVAFDFGTIYRTGFQSLAFGMSVRNFSQEVKFEQDGFQLPLTFRMGISMNLMDFLEHYAKHHALLLAIDAVHPRSHAEYLGFGLEYTLLQRFSLRAGYISSQDEYNFTYGLGFSEFGLSLDYAYQPFGVFEDVQKLTIHFSL